MRRFDLFSTDVNLGRLWCSVQFGLNFNMLQVLEVIKRKPNMRKISFVAHSVGGLVARYAIGRLYQPPKIEKAVSTDDGQEEAKATIAGLEPINFITVATPHLGSRGNKQVSLFQISKFYVVKVFVLKR